VSLRYVRSKSHRQDWPSYVYDRGAGQVQARDFYIRQPGCRIANARVQETEPLRHMSRTEALAQRTEGYSPGFGRRKVGTREESEPMSLVLNIVFGFCVPSELCRLLSLWLKSLGFEEHNVARMTRQFTLGVSSRRQHVL
jgi:hypothetical protein